MGCKTNNYEYNNDIENIFTTFIVKLISLNPNISIDYLMNSYFIFKKLYKKSNEKIAKLYTCIGNKYYELKIYEKTNRYFMNALRIFKNEYGESNKNFGELYNNLGDAYYQLNDYNNSIKYYKKALIIFKNIYDERNINIGIIYYNIEFGYY